MYLCLGFSEAYPWAVLGLQRPNPVILIPLRKHSHKALEHKPYKLSSGIQNPSGYKHWRRCSKLGSTLKFNHSLTQIKGRHGDDSDLKRGRFCMRTSDTKMRNRPTTCQCGCKKSSYHIPYLHPHWQVMSPELLYKSLGNVPSFKLRCIHLAAWEGIFELINPLTSYLVRSRG